MKRTAFDIMRSWDVEAGIPPRTDEALMADVPGSLTNRAFSGDWDEWLEALERGDVAAIIEGRLIWGLRPLV